MDVKTIENKLLSCFDQAKVSVKDLSGSGDYIQIDIEADEFKDKTTVEQHQMVYKALGEWLKKDIHAVVINTSIPRA